jgi:hypothetical protein
MPNGAERCEASLQHKRSDLSPPQDRNAVEVLRRRETTEVPGQTVQAVGIHPPLAARAWHGKLDRFGFL